MKLFKKSIAIALATTALGTIHAMSICKVYPEGEDKKSAASTTCLNHSADETKQACVALNEIKIASPSDIQALGIVHTTNRNGSVYEFLDKEAEIAVTIQIFDKDPQAFIEALLPNSALISDNDANANCIPIIMMVANRSNHNINLADIFQRKLSNSDRIVTFLNPRFFNYHYKNGCKDYRVVCLKSHGEYSCPHSKLFCFALASALFGIMFMVIAKLYCPYQPRCDNSDSDLDKEQHCCTADGELFAYIAGLVFFSPCILVIIVALIDFFHAKCDLRLESPAQDIIEAHLRPLRDIMQAASSLVASNGSIRRTFFLSKENMLRLKELFYCNDKDLLKNCLSNIFSEN